MKQQLTGFIQRRRLPIAIVLAALILGTGALFGWMRLQQRVQTRPALTQQAAPATPAALDPLTIDAISRRTYTGSQLTSEQDLGAQGGYHNQIVSYSSDNYKIYALQSTPDVAAPAGGWPVVILNHGYINPASYQTDGPEYRQFIATLAQAGYMVVKPDYRGHGRSQGTPEGGHFSPAFAYDALNLVATLKQTPGINPARIAMLGHSLGAHVTLRAIVVSKDIKTSILLAGVVGSMNDLFYNWPRSPAPYDRPRNVVQGKRAELVRLYGEPKDNPTFWNSVSALNYVDRVTGPVQINHDEGDSMVPVTFSQHLAAELRRVGKPAEYNLYPGDDHQFVQNRTALLQNMLRFLQANL